MNFHFLSSITLYLVGSDKDSGYVSPGKAGESGESGLSTPGRVRRRPAWKSLTRQDDDQVAMM